MTSSRGATESEIAVVTAAALALLAPPVAATEPPPPTWRFSGRWFHAHPYDSHRRPSV